MLNTMEAKDGKERNCPCKGWGGGRVGWFPRVRGGVSGPGDVKVQVFPAKR